MPDLIQALATILADAPTRLVLSKQASKTQDYRKVIIEKKSDCYQIAKYTEKQVFHENCDAGRLADYLSQAMGCEFLQLNGWSEGKEHQILMSKKGTVTYKKRSFRTPHSQKRPRPTIERKTTYYRKAARSRPSSTWASSPKKETWSAPCMTSSARLTVLSS